MAKAKFEFKVKGLDKAIKTLGDFTVEDFANRLIMHLADIGVETARTAYALAPYAGDNSQITVKAVPQGKMRVKIIATGQPNADGVNSILFIEFGAGFFKESAPMAVMELKSGHPDAHGTYGKGKGKNPKGWVYVGYPGAKAPMDTREVGQTKDGTPVTRTMGQPATPGMYYARREIIRAIERTAKELGMHVG